MRRIVCISTIGLLAMIQYGCRTVPAPQRANVPSRSGPYGLRHEHDEMKPLPRPERRTELPRTYDDAPLVTQRPPEQKAFVEAYERVGRPRLMVMAMSADSSGTTVKDIDGIDYAAVETILADWLSANGQVSLISPASIPARPAPTTGKESDVPQPDADVLVRVQVNPTRRDVREARLIAEAVNTRGGDSIGRAVVDVPTPLEKARLNEATRFIARKLMDEMTESWNRLAGGRPPIPAAAPIAPTTRP